MPYAPTIPLNDRVSMLNRMDKEKSPQEILQPLLTQRAGRFALVSSFGADSVVLLHMVAQIDKTTPVIFIDTQMLFRATLKYQLEVAQTLGLTDVRRISPDTNDLFLQDTDCLLHQADADACCALRKVEPLQKALQGFEGWISGRKRHQSSGRTALPLWEADRQTRLKTNPLALWTAQDVAHYIDAHDLPRHPLIAQGFPSIGCEPCTFRPKPGLDARSGRWQDQDKTECGIHFAGPVPEPRFSLKGQ